MTSRTTNRLVTALLLALAAFGIPGSAITTARFHQAIVCIGDRRPSQPQRISEPRAAATSRPVVQWTVARRDQRPPDKLLLRERFQRPPPLPLSRS